MVDSASSEQEETLQIASKNWKRVMNAACQSGYREGKEDGSQSVFQEGFDIGYEDAFKTAFILGKYKAIMTSTSNNVAHSSNIQVTLDKTRRGTCYICDKEFGKLNLCTYTHNNAFSQIRNEQNTYSKDIANSLRKYFEPVLKNQNIDISELNL